MQMDLGKEKEIIVKKTNSTVIFSQMVSYVLSISIILKWLSARAQLSDLLWALDHWIYKLIYVSLTYIVPVLLFYITDI